jgi:hypothetical protein
MGNARVSVAENDIYMKDFDREIMMEEGKLRHVLEQESCKGSNNLAFLKDTGHAK